MCSNTLYAVWLGCSYVTVSEYLQCSCPASKKLTAAGAGRQGDVGEILGWKLFIDSSIDCTNKWRDMSHCFSDDFSQALGNRSQRSFCEKSKSWPELRPKTKNRPSFFCHTFQLLYSHEWLPYPIIPSLAAGPASSLMVFLHNVDSNLTAALDTGHNTKWAHCCTQEIL